ncbi:metal-dependent transcriptional regulator [Bacteroidota bacterium]
MITVSTEDYLKVIYNETRSCGEAVSTSKLAQKLEISSAAISDMVKKLAKQGYVEYAKYKGMVLTRKGEKIALKVIRRHRLWEAFLIKSLGFSWSEVHQLAEKLEHNSPDILIEKIDEYLGYPEYDPHGHPIPKNNGEMPKLTGLISLDNGVKGKKYQIEIVDDSSEELINYFTKIGVILHRVVVLKDRLSFDNSCLVQIGKSEYSLSELMTKKLFVTEVSN